MRVRRSLVRLAILLAAIALTAAACGGDDDSSSSTTTTTTTTSGGGGGGSTSTTTSTPGNNPATDAAIEEMQRELNTLGCNAGPIDGEVGPDTEAAIRHFQQAAGIAVDGIVGPQTRAALATAARTGNPSCRNVPPPPPPPSTSTTTTTGGGNQPNCNEQLINAAVVAALNPGETVSQSGPFECAGDWATVSPTIAAQGGPEITITDLLRWNGSAWQVVDRAIYCANGSVPQQIYQDACESN
jgi:hypothetical protein